MKSTIRVKSIQSHRNGVSGNGFTVVLFSIGRGKSKQNMVATVFPERGNVAVLDADMTAAGNIQFGENSYRAEDFEQELRAAIGEDDKDRRVSILAAERDVLRGTLKDAAKLVQVARQHFLIMPNLRMPAQHSPPLVSETGQPNY